MDVIDVKSKPAESGSLRLIYSLLILGLMFTVNGASHWEWPSEGDFLWKLGYAVGTLNSSYAALFFAGVLCVFSAAGIQLIRLIFRSRR